jgi:hypothetical protein
MLESLELAPETRELILAHNAMEFLGLTADLRTTDALHRTAS